MKTFIKNDTFLFSYQIIYLINNSLPTNDLLPVRKFPYILGDTVQVDTPCRRSTSRRIFGGSSPRRPPSPPKMNTSKSARALRNVRASHILLIAGRGNGLIARKFPQPMWWRCAHSSNVRKKMAKHWSISAWTNSSGGIYPLGGGTKKMLLS